MGATMDNLLAQWMEEADVQTTDVFDQITYENVTDYLPAEVKDAIAESQATEQALQQVQEEAAAQSETGGDTATEQPADAAAAE